MNVLKFFGIMLLLFVLWIATSGPEQGRGDRPFLQPPPPLGSGERYGPTYSGPSIQSGSTENQAGGSSPGISDENTVFIQSILRASETDPEREYIILAAPQENTTPINISSLRLESAFTNSGTAIGQGSYLPFSGKVNPQQVIFLAPGERAIVTTGESPIGTSFRLNICTGYFEQFQDFTPALPRECPRPVKENLSLEPGGVNDECIEYLETFRSCEAHTKSFPLELSDNPQCQEYVSENVHYNGCVENHKNEPDFYKKEWRVFLDLGEELWRNKRETIRLVNEKGLIIDEATY